MKSDEPGTVRKLFAKLRREPLRTFPEMNKTLDAPGMPGVYVICCPRGEEVLYVGRTSRITRRLKQHMGHKSGKRSSSSFVKRYGPLGGDGSRLRQDKHMFRCLVVDDARDRALLEAYAIGHLCPAHVGTG